MRCTLDLTAVRSEVKSFLYRHFMRLNCSVLFMVFNAQGKEVTSGIKDNLKKTGENA